METKDLLGCTVEDIITGYRGVVTGVVSYITGCDQALIAGKSDGTAEAPSAWYDVNRIKVDKDMEKLSLSGAAVSTTGPDKQAPIR